jgi:hypothetical protein
MKPINLLFITFIAIAAKGQTIIPLDTYQEIFIHNSGAYYKDTNNLFNTFEGTWQWDNPATNETFIMVLKKEYVDDTAEEGYSYDLLVGEYFYRKNGTVEANTLANINNPNVVGNYHAISGIVILRAHNKPPCPECTPTDKRMLLTLNDEDDPDNVIQNIVLRHFTENGVEKIHLKLYGGYWGSLNENEEIDMPHIPEIVLTKQ